MSKLIVEVCEIEEVFPHPNADKLEVCRVKGWLTVVQKGQFKAHEKCVFFPPDSILPPALCHGPEDNPPGRMNNIKYLHALAKDEFGNRPAGGRVVATRLRGHVSYGVIMSLDPNFGDDLNWEIGQDVADHFGVTKYEPPLETNEGDADRSNSKFYKYTSIEHFENYPKSFTEGEEVIITEKIHGRNSRVGLVLENDENGVAQWTFMAGSHDVRRKEFSRVETRFRISELEEMGILSLTPNVGEIFENNGRKWQIETIFDSIVKTPIVGSEPPSFEEKIVPKIQCVEVDKNNNFVLCRSEYWEPMTERVKALLEHVKDNFTIEQPKYSIILYGEIFGNVQDMTYGLQNSRSFRAFDIAVNNEYLDYDQKVELFTCFGIQSVPILYKGPFSVKIVEEYTSGPTTMCDPKVAGPFKGREGIVITPVVEEHYNKILNGRKIVKSVSADYHARKKGTEYH